MSIKHFIFSLFFFFPILSFCQQKEDIYFKHITGNKDYCLCSAYRDGRDKRKVEFEHKFSLGFFIFNDDFFEVKPNTFIEEITEVDAKKLNIVTIDYFQRKREETKVNQLIDPNSLFNKIYILVPSNGKYFKFEVKWKEKIF